MSCLKTEEDWDLCVIFSLTHGWSLVDDYDKITLPTCPSGCGQSGSVNGPSVALVLCQIKLLEFSQFQRQFVKHSVHFVERT